jgi:L-rhamnose 1-dehydrogenase
MTSSHGLLNGKVAAITGGLTGIGRAIAIGFIEHGCKVAINYLGGTGEAELLREMENQLEPYRSCFVNVAGDISKPGSGKALVDRAVEEWGRLDIFVSNAGICQFAEFLE